MYWPVDLMLITFGCSIYSSNKSKLLQLVNWLFRIWLIIDSIHYFIVKLYEPSRTLTGNMEDVSFMVGVIFTQALLIIKRDKIRHLLQQVNSMADGDTQRYLTSLSIGLSINYIIALTLGLGCTLTILLNSELYEKSIRNYFFWIDVDTVTPR